MKKEEKASSKSETLFQGFNVYFLGEVRIVSFSLFVADLLCVWQLSQSHRAFQDLIRRYGGTFSPSLKVGRVRTSCP